MEQYRKTDSPYFAARAKIKAGEWKARSGEHTPLQHGEDTMNDTQKPVCPCKSVVAGLPIFGSYRAIVLLERFLSAKGWRYSEEFDRWLPPKKGGEDATV